MFNCYLFLRMGKTSVCLEVVRVERTPFERERLKIERIFLLEQGLEGNDLGLNRGVELA